MIFTFPCLDPHQYCIILQKNLTMRADVNPHHTFYDQYKMTTLMTQHRFALKIVAASILFAFGSGAFAQEAETEPTAPPAHAGAKSPSKHAAAKPDPKAAKPFKDVIQGATEIEGFFTLYRKDDKVWIAIKPEQLDNPFFFSVNIPSSLGERGLYAGQMGASHMAFFKKIGNRIQLIAKNTEFTAQAGTPQAHTVAQAFSDSLLASATVVSAPDVDTKAFLIEANALLFTDIPGYSTRMEYAYRLQFALDVPNTSFSGVWADCNLSSFYVNAHFAIPRIAARPVTPSPKTMPDPPGTTPDPRSAFVGFYYNFAALPKTVMQPRPADDRVGHFVTTHYDTTEDTSPNAAQHFVNRWRLEKQDPSAALSEPVTPIVYWLDKNIPEKYRQSVTAGILEWNLAFEKIGFKNAIVAKQQSETDDFNTLDARHASIRWFAGADVGFAIGPSQVDPRSGEIIDADIGMSDVFARGARRVIGEDNGLNNGLDNTLGSTGVAGDSAHQLCDYAHEAQHEMGFAFGLLEARGDFGMDSPKADELAQAYVKDVIMHEVGHTLGLRHNFRSSSIYTLQQIQNPEFTKKNGLTGSVMDYTPFNLAAKGEKQGEYVMSTLGPYDYWAIEYAYRPLDAHTEKADLGKIAARSTEPLLAYGTDEDSGIGISDPDVNVFDLGGDPLAYFKKRLSLSRELWDRLQTKQLKHGDSYDTLRRSFDYGFGQFLRTVPIAAKYVGGVTYLRDHAGSGRATFAPVPAQRQREALHLLTNSLFKPDSFKFAPGLVRHLTGDRFERKGRPDVSIAERVLAMQKATLDRLMADGVATRLLDSQEKVSDSKQVLSLSELYDGLQEAIWSELKTGREVAGMRRNLQREHLKRIANTLLNPSESTPADARSLQRANALGLQHEIRTAMGKPMSKESKAHLADAYNTLSEALKAPLARAGV
jgi:hypothetical protein